MASSRQGGQTIRIAAEGASLAARFYPAVGTPRAHLVLHGATGVAQRYYAPFARWAARQGLGVLTYDYRDFGESADRPLRESRATFADWAVRDQAAAEQCLASLAPEGPLWVLGHSLGGLGFVFVRHPARVERIITVGAGIGHFTDHPWSYRPTALAFWFLLGPLATWLAGYLPGRRILLGADLPAGVFWQWRRWCTRRDFYRSDIGRTLPEPDVALAGPRVRMLAMRDDAVVPPVAVRRYHAAFPEGRVTYRELQPDEFGLASLRHVTVFAPACERAWPAILDFEEDDSAG